LMLDRGEVKDAPRFLRRGAGGRQWWKLGHSCPHCIPLGGQASTSGSREARLTLKGATAVPAGVSQRPLREAQGDGAPIDDLMVLSDLPSGVTQVIVAAMSGETGNV
jgi:hypothetical protein